MVAHEQELAVKFAAIVPVLRKWGEVVDATICSIVDVAFEDTNFIQMRPKFRCKDELSFIKKVLYRSKLNNYPDPLIDVEDKVATRIVLLTTDNVEKVKRLLMACESWDYKISKDTKEFSRENPNLFDYQSVHIVVWPKVDFEQTDKHLLTCEVQIRTLLEHAYAEVTHDSVYKGPHQNDTVIKRQLSKCMALMETTDDMFCSIFNKISITSDSEDYEFKRLVIKAADLCNNVLDIQINYKKSDLYFLDAVHFLYQQYPISFDLLEYYTRSHEEDIKHAMISPQASVLAKDPAALILFCYLENFEQLVTERWPLSMHIVDNMRESLGISAGEF